jgi:CBS domain-containing protein
MRLQDVLLSKPDHMITMRPKAPLSQASALMMMESVGAVLVREGGRFLGILSERDLAVAIAVRGPELFSLCAGELMSVGAPIAAPGDSITDVLRMMMERRARHLPVVDGGAVVGMVSLGDVLSRLAEKAQENAVLQALPRARLPA